MTGAARVTCPNHGPEDICPDCTFNPAGCAACRVNGPACGPCSVPSGNDKAPCVRPDCGLATLVRSPCGAPRHYHALSGPIQALGPARPAPAPAPGPQDYPGPDGRPDWKGQAAARKVALHEKEQPILRAELLDAGLPADRLTAAVALWNDLMRGIDYGGGHRTALGILNGTFRHRGIPDLPEPAPAELAPPPDGPVWSARSWLIREHEDGPIGAKLRAELDAMSGYADLASFDVNGMYLGAAAIDLGTGEPVRIDWPDESVFKRCGWVRVSTLENAPWGIGDRWQEGMWMPVPLVAYLRDAGAEFLMVEALISPKQRRWLDPHVDLMRAARTALLDAGTPEALAVLRIVKDIYTRMFGGLLESVKHNDSNTLRPWWKASITGTGQARMFRGLDKTRELDKVRAGGVRHASVIGVHVDAAWFVMPRGYEVPPGLEISGKLGKWKPAGRVPWTADLCAAYVEGQPRPIWRALHEVEATA